MPTNGSEDGAVRQHLNLAANSLIDRSSLMQSLLGGSRDIDRDCNYPKGVVPRELYQELYDREPIAARVVEVYPKECWQVQPSVYEDEDSETETTFEKAWADLATSIRAEKSYHQDEQGSVLWEYLYRADVLSGIGHYGIILLGIDDGKDLSEPADLVVDSVSDEVTLAPEGTPWTPLPGTPEAGPIGETGPRLGSRGTGASGSAATDYNQGARTKGFANGKNRTWSWNQGNGKGGPKRKLTFLRVFPESMAWIDQFDSNPASPRFGQPVRYTLLFNDPAAQAAGVGLQMITAPVHWTRVIHVADNLASSEVFGLPRMQAVLNRLLDIRKIHGGSAEMYWRGAFPGYALETLPQLGTEVDIDQEGVKKMMWDWANGLQRHVVLTGLTMKSLSPQVTDPSPQVNTQIEAICIKIGVPVRIFKGSERGELASSQDDAAWNDRLKQRQAGYVTPRLVVPFVDRLIALGVLPAPEGYSVWWPDLTSKSDQEKAAIASQRTTALVAYGSSPPTQDIITPTDYLIKVQGFDEAEAQSIVENAQTEKDKREKEQLKQQQEQADAEHQRQLELATAGAPQQPPPDAGGDGGDGGPGTQSVLPSGPVDSSGGSSITNSGVTHNYDPSQPRDEGGKWSGAGGSRPTGERPSVSVVSREETNSTGRKVVFFHVAEDEKSRIKAFVTPEALRIKSTFVSDSRRGKGWGTALYEEAARYAASKGLRLESDEFVSADAVRVWDALARRGYKVTRHKATPDSEGGFNAVQDKGPVFSVPPGAVTHNYDSARPGESDGAVIDGVGDNQITPERGREPLGNAAKHELTGGRWVTVDGVHVYVKGGKIVAGPAALEGHPPSDLKSIHQDAHAHSARAETATHKAETGGSRTDHVEAMQHHANAAHSHALAAQHPDNKTPEASKAHAEAASAKAAHHATEAGHGDTVKHPERAQTPKATEPQEVKAGSGDKSIQPATSPKEDYQKNGTRSETFKKWFGDWEKDPASASKVVDPHTGEPKETHGEEPKVVYHGRQATFDTFDMSKAKSTEVGLGAYFAEDRRIANSYATMGGKKGDILTAYLSIKNPFNFDATVHASEVEGWSRVTKGMPGTGAKYFISTVKAYQRRDGNPDGTMPGHVAWNALKDAVGDTQANKVLEKLGYDGIVHTAQNADGVVRRKASEPNFGRVWVAFAPTQIKAKDNAGTFDQSSANIYNEWTDSSDWWWGSKPLGNAGKTELTGGRWVTVGGRHVYIKDEATTGQTSSQEATHETEVIGHDSPKLPSLRKEAEAFPDGPRRKEALQALSPSRHDVVITTRHGGTLSGVASVWKSADTAEEGVPPGSYIRVRNMATARSGTGKVLFAEILQHASSQGAGVYLSSLEGSTRFYQSLGLHQGQGATYYLTPHEVKALPATANSQGWETMNEEALGVLFPPGDSAVEGELDLGLVLNWDSNWEAVQALIENISEERGASQEESRRLEGILSSVDITTFKPLCATLHVNDSQPAPIGSVTVLPPVIANYLAYSTARNPSTTLMAARDLVRDTASKVVGWRDPASELVAQEFHPTTIFDPDLGLVLNVTKEWQLEVVSNLHDTLKDHDYSDWYIALLSAALDETNDVVRAVELANEAFDERDEDPEPDPQMGVENYDPSQSRDKSGRWVAGGGSIEREEWGHSQGDTFHAVIGGERVGSAKLFEDYSHSARERWGSSAYYVSGLHVDESHRRRGAATAIYRAILEHISPSYLVPEFSRMPGGAALWDSLVKLPDVEVKRVEHEGLVQVGIRKRQPSSTTNYDLSQVHSRTAGGADFADLDNVLDNLAANAVTGPNPWAPYVGPRGGRGWKNSMTGRVFYGARQPGLGRGHVPVVPGAASPGAPAPVAPAPAAVAGKPKAQPASPASVKAHIARLLTNPSQITAAHIHDVKEELLSMNIAQIHSVKRDLGLGASGPKATLAAKIAQKALAGLGKAQPKPPTPAPTPPQHQAPAPAQRPTPAATPPHQASTPTPAQHQPTAPAAVPAHTTGTSAPSPLHKGANVITGAPAQAPPAPSHLPVVPHKDEIEWSTGKPQPGTLHGVDFAPAPHHFWEHVKDKDVGEPPPTRPIRRAGVMIQEPDGRIWIVKPTNEFGDRTYTLPGGGVEKGLTHQQNALKEVWEETGLQVEITGHLGDFRDSNNKNIGRLYIGKRVGGAPWDAKIEPHIIDRKTGKPGAESSEVVLVTPERARKLLHRTDDLAQLMTVAPPPVGTATRGKGSQALIKFVEAIQPATKDFLNKGKATGSTKPGNGELHAVQEIRGFNEKPKVVSKKDMDTLLAGGDHIEMLRGLGSFGSTSAKDLAQQFREGDHYPGFGCFGSGTYADSTKGYSNAASGYASSYSRDSAMLRIALPKTARIIKQSELEKKVPINPEDFKGYQNTQGGYSAREEWHGVQAALAGYDAIEVDGKSNHHHSYGKGYYVILNRSVLTVQKEDAKGHMIS